MQHDYPWHASAAIAAVTMGLTAGCGTDLTSVESAQAASTCTTTESECEATGCCVEESPYGEPWCNCFCAGEGGTADDDDYMPLDDCFIEEEPEPEECTAPPPNASALSPWSLKIDSEEEGPAPAGMLPAIVRIKLDANLQPEGLECGECESCAGGTLSGYVGAGPKWMHTGVAIDATLDAKSCSTKVCNDPPQWECSAPGCIQGSATLNSSLSRTIGFDLAHYVPDLFSKFFNAKAELTMAGGVELGVHGSKGQGVGSCSDCCSNGDWQFFASASPRFGGSGEFKWTLGLLVGHVDVHVNAAVCGAGTGTAGRNCEGSPDGDVEFDYYLAACVAGPNRACLGWGWFKVCVDIGIEGCAETGDKGSCPAGV